MDWMAEWGRKLQRLWLPYQSINVGPPTPSDLHTLAIALGSNLGDRFANIETALHFVEVLDTLLKGLDDEAKVSVIDTSFMYETAPVYVIDQPRFANCTCMVSICNSRHIPVHL